jgi:disease resistance protein RPM1
MITSRSCDVAELVHCTYKIQPLCPDSSKILLYGRIFESQDRCPERFSELFDKILKKCGGVPLAIITIASLLANKSDDITQWQEVCSSIGSGLSSSNDMRNDMRKILSLSYYDLPRHMKTCFLYLSMYPEDYEIRRDGLIWRWISEGFIQPRKKEDGLFDLGKSYFNDLINRSLMQPDFDRYGEIYGCRVHDMILDLICSLSREENFVTTSDDIDQEMASESKKFRRISLEKTATWPKKGVSQVRSIAAFYPRIDSMPPFSCLDMLRVLDLDHCNLIHLGGSSKLSIGNLIHLRYLGLRGTGQDGLPGGIEKLQFLEVLSMGGSVKLPESIFRLRRLMCLEGVNCSPQPGNLLRNLASLQVLQRLRVEKDHVGTVKALGYLTQLTKLEIGIWSSGMVDPSIYDTFIDSLCNLGRLQSLQMYTVGLYSRFPWHRWTPPPHLSELEVKITTMLTLPKWISPASLPHLVHLFIEVFHAVGPEDIQILGTLPNLVVLWLGADYQNYLKQPLLKFVVSADAFPRLENCSFVNVAAVPSTFTRRAMPRVRYITFSLRARDFISEADGGLDFDDLAMDHLPSLKVVHCEATGYEEEEQMNTKLREAVEHAVEVHPNHPNIACYYTQKRI